MVVALSIHMENAKAKKVLEQKREGNHDRRKKKNRAFTFDRKTRKQQQKAGTPDNSNEKSFPLDLLPSNTIILSPSPDRPISRTLDN